MHSTTGDDDPNTDAPEPESGNAAVEGLDAVGYLRLAEECMSLAALTTDPEKAAELIKTGDEYLRRRRRIDLGAERASLEVATTGTSSWRADQGY